MPCSPHWACDSSSDSCFAAILASFRFEETQIRGFVKGASVLLILVASCSHLTWLDFQLHHLVSVNGGTPLSLDGLLRENPIKMDDLRFPHFRKPSFVSSAWAGTAWAAFRPEFRWRFPHLPGSAALATFFSLRLCGRFLHCWLSTTSSSIVIRCRNLRFNHDSLRCRNLCFQPQTNHHGAICFFYSSRAWSNRKRENRSDFSTYRGTATIPSGHSRMIPLTNEAWFQRACSETCICFTQILLPYGSKHCLRRYLTPQINLNHSPSNSWGGTWIHRASQGWSF